MKYLPLLLCLLVACSPSGKLKRAERLIKKAVAQGAKVDSLKTVKVDTLRIPGQTVFIPKIIPGPVDTLKIKEPCAEVLRKPTPAAVKRLQKVVCPTLNVDTAYTVTMQVQGKTYRLPIRVKIGEGYSVSVGPLNVPVIKQEVKVGISAGYTTWGLIWRVALFLLLGLIIGFVLGKVLGWSPF